MTLGNVKKSLARISSSLQGVQDSREYVLKNSREIIVLCSRAIIAIHAGDPRTAGKNLEKAGRLAGKLRKRASGDLARYMVPVEQEFVEASALMAVAGGRQIPSDRELGVMPESYVLGLLDCIGELKRTVFDRIRAGDAEGAAGAFGIMEGLFLDLYTFSMYDKVVKEARRKIDVNRILVEDARSAVTEEKRRSDLIGALRAGSR